MCPLCTSLLCMTWFMDSSNGQWHLLRLTMYTTEKQARDHNHGVKEVGGTNRQDRKQCVAGTDVYKRVKLFYPIHKMMATIHSICLQCVLLINWLDVCYKHHHTCEYPQFVGFVAFKNIHNILTFCKHTEKKTEKNDWHQRVKLVHPLNIFIFYCGTFGILVM